MSINEVGYIDADQFLKGVDPTNPDFYVQMRNLVRLVNKNRVEFGPDFVVDYDENGIMCSEYHVYRNFWPIMVNLTEDGGIDGDKTIPATYTYTVMNLYDTFCFGTEMTPINLTARANLGSILSGNEKVGMAYFAPDGEFILYEPNEQPVRAAC